MMAQLKWSDNRMIRTDYKEALKFPIFSTISDAADELGLETYVISGYVRDFLLNK